ncbi:MAG: hypothetical protein ABEH81_16260 [Halopenitus sp.]
MEIALSLFVGFALGGVIIVSFEMTWHDHHERIERERAEYEGRCLTTWIAEGKVTATLDGNDD